MATIRIALTGRFGWRARSLAPIVTSAPSSYGEKAVHIIDPRRRVRRLPDAGIDAAAAQRAGQLDLLERRAGNARLVSGK